MKVCSRCGQRKSLREFNRDPSRRDGRHPYCTACKTAPYRRPGHLDAHRARVRARTEKPCKGCHTVKPLADFYVNRRALDGRSSRCRTCLKKESRSRYDPLRARDYYRDHRVQMLQRVTGARRARKLALVLLRGGKCHDCPLRPSKKWPISVFDFHHANGSKEHGLARLLGSKKTWDRAVSESAKCIVLCSNCHRRRHDTGAT